MPYLLGVLTIYTVKGRWTWYEKLYMAFIESFVITSLCTDFSSFFKVSLPLILDHMNFALVVTAYKAESCFHNRTG